MKQLLKKYLTFAFVKKCCFQSIYWMLGIWCLGALWFAFFRTLFLQIPVSLLFLLVWTAAPFLAGRIKHIRGAVLLAEFCIVFCFLCIRPTNNHVWKPSFGKNPVAVFNDPAPGWVTIRDVRDFYYRSELDFDVKYKDMTFNLNELQSVDFYMVHWNSEYIAHTMLSFGFSGGQHLVLSIETRIPEGLEQNSVAGLYKQYNLLMIWGTERDLIGLRTNHRIGEDVYLYPTNTTPLEAQELLVSLLRRTNDLKKHPRFYNTVTANCTNFLAPSMKKTWSLDSIRSVVFNGHVDEIARNAGWLQELDPEMNYADYKAKHYVNPRVKEFGELPEREFSEKLRNK